MANFTRVASLTAFLVIISAGFIHAAEVVGGEPGASPTQSADTSTGRYSKNCAEVFVCACNAGDSLLSGKGVCPAGAGRSVNHGVPDAEPVTWHTICETMNNILPAATIEIMCSHP